MTGKCFMVQPFDGGRFDKRFDDVLSPAVRSKGLIQVEMFDGQDGPFEGYRVNESGWDWITGNAHSLNLKATPKGKRRIGFDKAVDDEIPF